MDEAYLVDRGDGRGVVVRLLQQRVLLPSPAAPLGEVALQTAWTEACRLPQKQFAPKTIAPKKGKCKPQLSMR